MRRPPSNTRLYRPLESGPTPAQGNLQLWIPILLALPICLVNSSVMRTPGSRRPESPALSEVVVALLPSTTGPEPDLGSVRAAGWDPVWPVESMEPKGLGQGQRELWVSVEMWESVER